MAAYLFSASIILEDTESELLVEDVLLGFFF